jgi:uncharacterized protein (DUF2252 family)
MMRHDIRGTSEKVTSEAALPDVRPLVRQQIAHDKAKTAWKPNLIDRKNARMQVSPFSFLRGTASLYYELLAAAPGLAKGPPGAGWLVGDLHIENFGAFRRAAPHDDGPDVAFDLNDFDDAVQGPWYLDVLRLTTSILLASRARGLPGVAALQIARLLLDGYRETLSSGDVPKQPRLIAKLIEQTATRTRGQLLDDRTKLVGKHRKFVHGDRYDPLPEELREGAAHVLDTYSPADGGPRPSPENLEVIDAAFRIAGTGSLGCRRIAVLTSGRGGPDGGWIFDVKEEGAPSAEVLLGKCDLKPNVRVTTGARACLLRPPHMLGTATLAGRPMLVRRLMPQEDKLDSATLRPEEFHELAPYFGGLAARAHLRGATESPKQPWSAHDVDDVLMNALVLAGWHESAYLAFCSTLKTA